MPYTVNGIGTHYYGSRNRSPRLGTCGSCRRDVTLSSYDTREWFCVLFVPLIPLRAFRVIDYCSSCSRHHRLSLADYNAQLDEATRPLREAVLRTPGDAAAHAELVRTLIGYQRHNEAAQAVDAALARHRDDVDLNILGGVLAFEAADWTRALTFYGRATRLAPDNASAAYSYGWLLNRMQQPEKAIAALQRATSDANNRIPALYIMAKAQMQLSRWQDAMQTLQQLASHDAQAARDKSVLRLLGDCKKQLGYELTPAERKASRRWWPFGSRKMADPPKLAGQPVLVRPVLKWAGIALAVVIAISLGIVAWDTMTNIPVYFDNGLKRPVNVELDGRTFYLGNDRDVKQTVKEGRHTVIVRDAKSSTEIERETFTVERLGPIDAMTEDRFFVYNVSGARVYRRAVVGYAKNESDQTYEEEYIALQRFFEQRNVDYPFADPPKEVEASSTSSKIHKVAFKPAREIDLSNYALYRLGQGKNDEARKAIDHAVALTPCDTRTRRLQLAIDGAAATPDAAVAVAREWMKSCEADDLEAQRAYQDLFITRGLTEQMRTEYAAKVAADPASAKAHYLNGRVQRDSAAALAEYNEAIRRDPKLLWPRVAVAHAYAMDGRYTEAMEQYTQTLGMPGRDPEVIMYYAFAAVAGGATEEAIATVDVLRHEPADAEAAMEARHLLALAAGDWATAAQLQETLAKNEPPEVAWLRRVRMLRMQGDEQAIVAELAKAPDAAVALQVKIERAIEKNDLAMLPGLLAQGRKELDPSLMATLQLYASGVYSFAGQPGPAAHLLDEAAKDQQWPMRLLVDGATGRASEADVLAEARTGSFMQHGWFVAALRAGDKARAAEYLTRAQKAAADLEFPYLEVKAMAARLR